MRNINIFLVSLMAFITFSCSEDFLDRQPYNKLTTTNFYKNSAQISEALTAAYDISQRDNWNAFIIISEIASDNCTSGGGINDNESLLEYDEFYNLEFDMNLSHWQNNYTGVKRANLVVENVENVEWAANEAGLKEKILGEARFLRAFYYFKLARLFGNIPLVTSVIAPSDAYIPNAKPEEVYKFILEDLKYAAENLPAVPYASMNANDYGHATKWAAESMLARVWLFYTGYYKKDNIAGIAKADVTNYIDDVIKNSGHDLMADFEKLWIYSTPDNVNPAENNIENVFSIKFTISGAANTWSQNDGSRWQVMIGPRNKNYPPYGKGWGAAPVNESLYNAYDSTDTRRDGSIINWDKVFGAGVYDDADQRNSTRFGWRKYCPLAVSATKTLVESKGGNFMNDNFQDEYIIRYADVLLMAAELHFGDGSGKDLEYVNKVRQRAYKDKFVPKSSVTLAEIFEERRLEFALEGIRYWDLLRQGLDVAKSKLEAASTKYPVKFPVESGGFLKIPESQISLSNGSLKQNDYWTTGASYQPAQ